MKKVYIYTVEDRIRRVGSECRFTVNKDIAATCNYPVEQSYDALKIPVGTSCVAFCKGGNKLSNGAIYQYGSGTYYYVVVREE